MSAPRIPCPGCNKTYGRVYELERHIQRLPAGHPPVAHPRPVDRRARGNRAGTQSEAEGTPPPTISPEQRSQWICDMCGASFTRKDSLQEHVRNSMNKRPCTQSPRARARNASNHSDTAAPGSSHFPPAPAPYPTPVPRRLATHNVAPPPPNDLQSRGQTSFGSIAPMSMSLGTWAATMAPLMRASTPSSIPLPAELLAAIARADGRIRPAHDNHPHIQAALPATTAAPLSPMDLLAYASEDVVSMGGSTADLADLLLSTENFVEDEPLPSIVDRMFPQPTLHALPGPSDLADMYPCVPSAFFMPEPILSYVLRQFQEYVHVRTSVVHPPTFRRQLETGKAHPCLILAIFWAGMRMADPADITELVRIIPKDEHGEMLYADTEKYRFAAGGEVLRHILRDWEKIKPVLEAARADDVAEWVDPPEGFDDFMRAVVITCENALAAGLHSFTKRLHEIGLTAFSYLNFGRRLEDLLPKTTANPEELMRSELRSRLCTSLLNMRIAVAELADLISGISEDASKVRILEDGTYAPDWANVQTPMDDNLFDRLPPADDVEAWTDIHVSAESPTLHQLLSMLPIHPIGDIFISLQLAPDDARRVALAQDIGSTTYSAGYSATRLYTSAILEMFLRTKKLFNDRGWKLYAPPPGSEGEASVTELRSAVEQIWRGLPEDVRELADASDGRGLRELSALRWGRSRRNCLPQIVVNLQVVELILNSPSDIFYKIVPDEAWPFSESFIRAQASAITISRIIKSALEVDPGPQYESMRKDEVKRLPTLWSRVVLRACWVHVVSIRKFRLLLQNQGPDSSLISAAIQTIARLVDDVKATLAGLVDIGTSFRNLHAAYCVIRNLVDRDILSMLDPTAYGALGEEQVWAGPTVEEMEVLHGKLEPEDEGYKQAVEKMLKDDEPIDFAWWMAGRDQLRAPILNRSPETGSEF